MAEPPDIIAWIHPYMIELREVVKHQGGRMFVVQVKSVDLFNVDIGVYVSIDD